MNRFQNRRFSLGEFSGLGERIFDLAQRHFVESARRLFAIAGDKRNRVPLVEQSYRRLDLRWTNPECRGDSADRLIQVKTIE